MTTFNYIHHDDSIAKENQRNLGSELISAKLREHVATRGWLKWLVHAAPRRKTSVALSG
jgi:hypothetical protein